jgi:Tol biopolymer transport system component
MEVAFWWTGYDLLKINIETGETQKVLPNKDKEFISFAISPDETQIAYFRCQDQPNVIYIRNLETGQERTAKVASILKNYVIAGDIYWVPSGDGLVFQTQDDNFMIQTIYLNLAKMKQKVVKEYPMYFAPDWKRLQLQGWVDNRKLEYREEGDMGVQIIHLDIETMKTTMIGTSTPNP